MAIQSFACRETEALFKGKRIRRFASMERVAIRKLAMLQRAEVLQDLLIPPGNQLEAMRGDRLGQYSIRVNDKWRICFTWTETGPKNVEMVDYH
jgi:toxin HigB-1